MKTGSGVTADCTGLEIGEYVNRKEKISEWVPKQEFNQLNAEYTKLEKELEASQERLKSFALF